MPSPIKAKINVLKIVKEAMFKGDKGTYLDLVIWPNKEGPDKYGNTHTIRQGLSKERRDAGEKEQIIGDLKMPEETVNTRQPANRAQGAPPSRPKPPADP